MTLDKPTLEKELASLKTQQEQTVANLNAIAGAIKMTENLLLLLAKPEPKVAAKP